VGHSAFFVNLRVVFLPCRRSKLVVVGGFEPPTSAL
jgi:hypothetical protein